MLLQVFVNFAREQQAEDDGHAHLNGHAYHNHVDTTDELPLKPVSEWSESRVIPVNVV